MNLQAIKATYSRILTSITIIVGSGLRIRVSERWLNVVLLSLYDLIGAVSERTRNIESCALNRLSHLVISRVCNCASMYPCNTCLTIIDTGCNQELRNQYFSHEKTSVHQTVSYMIYLYRKWYLLDFLLKSKQSNW